MITDTGEELDVIIVTSPTKNWETFGTWYSINKNLPDAKVRIFCIRSPEPSYQLFQWAKRLQIPVHYTNPIGEVKITVDSIIDTTDKKNVNWLHIARLAQHNKLISENLLIVEPLTMVLSPLCPKEILGTLKNHESLSWYGDEAWLLKNVSQEHIENRIDDYYLNKNKIYSTNPSFVYDAKSTSEPKSIVSYKKGCGKWVHTATGCPFHNAAGLVRDEMTSNEREIIELWKKMVPLFSAAV